MEKKESMNIKINQHNSHNLKERKKNLKYVYQSLRDMVIILKSLENWSPRRKGGTKGEILKNLIKENPNLFKKHRSKKLSLNIKSINIIHLRKTSCSHLIRLQKLNAKRQSLKALQGISIVYKGIII
jgi:hypothetical protein